MFDIPTNLPSQVVPLAWLLGQWEGYGAIEYEIGETTHFVPFKQRVSFEAADGGYVEYVCEHYADRRVLDSVRRGEPVEVEVNALGIPEVAPHSGEQQTEPDWQWYSSELGFLRLRRPQQEGDLGPGMLPGLAPAPFATTESVEALRNSDKTFSVEFNVIHPTGVSELYLGTITGGRLQLATDAIMRSEHAKPHEQSTRMYGLVGGELMWAWDIAALDQPLATHASAKLTKVVQEERSDVEAVDE